MKSLPVVAALCFLAACGTEVDSAGGGEIAKTLLSSSFKKPASGSLGLTRAALQEVVSPVLLVTIDQRGQQALLGELQSNQGVETWATLDDVTISFRDGVIVATRGLGNDLMAADAGAAGRGAGSFSRAFSHLTGEDQPMRRVFACTATGKQAETIEIVEVSYATTRVSERCSAEGVTFENQYWFSSDQKLRKSRQWISEDVGYLTVEDLRP